MPRKRSAAEVNGGAQSGGHRARDPPEGLSFASLPTRPIPLEPARLHAYTIELQRLCSARLEAAKTLHNRKIFAQNPEGDHLKKFISECEDVLGFICASLTYLHKDFASEDIDTGDLPGLTIGTVFALCAGIVIRALEIFHYFDDLLGMRAADFNVGGGFVHARACPGMCHHHCRVGHPGFPEYVTDRGVSPPIEQHSEAIGTYTMTQCLDAWNTLATAWYGIRKRDLTKAAAFRQALLVRSLSLWAGVHRFPELTRKTNVANAEASRLPATAAAAEAVARAAPEETAAAAEYAYCMGPYDGSIGTDVALETTYSYVLLQKDFGGLVPRPRFGLEVVSRAFYACAPRRPMPRSVALHIKPYPAESCLHFFWGVFFHARTGTSDSEEVPLFPAPPEGVDPGVFKRRIIDQMAANLMKKVIDVKAERSATNFITTVCNWCDKVETNRDKFRMKTHNLVRMTTHDFRDAEKSPTYRQHLRLDLATYGLARYMSRARFEALPPFAADIAFLYLLGAHSKVHKGPSDFLDIFCGKSGGGAPASAAHFAARPSTARSGKRDGIGSAAAIAEASAVISQTSSPSLDPSSSFASEALAFMPPSTADGWPSDAELESGRWHKPEVLAEYEPRLFLIASDLVVVRVGTELYECPSVSHAVICLFALLWLAARDAGLAAALNGGDRLTSLIEDLSFVGLASQFAVDILDGTSVADSFAATEKKKNHLLGVDPWSTFELGGDGGNDSDSDSDVVMIDSE